jgi:hypothetical protein
MAATKIFALARNPRPEPSPAGPSPAQVAIMHRQPAALLDAQDELDRLVAELTTKRAELRGLIAGTPDREKGERPIRLLAGEVATLELAVREATERRDSVRAPYAQAIEKELGPVLTRSIRRCFWLLDEFVSELAIQGQILTELAHVGIERFRYPAVARSLVGALRQMLRRQVA